MDPKAVERLMNDLFDSKEQKELLKVLSWNAAKSAAEKEYKSLMNRIISK